MIHLASKAVAKNIDYEALRYGDDLYGHENDIDAVWPFVEEAQEIGRKAFREKYSDVKLFPGF